MNETHGDVPAMGLDKVVEEVLSSGRERRDDILAEAKEEADGILAAARAELEDYTRSKEREARGRIERMRAQEQQGSELEVRRLELAMRRELLSLVETAARERLSALPRARNEALLRALLATAKMPDGRVHSNATDEPLVRALSALRYAGNVKCLGGVVVESSDGTVREDLTYDTLLRETNESSLGDIARAMFKDGG